MSPQVTIKRICSAVFVLFTGQQTSIGHLTLLAFDPDTTTEQTPIFGTVMTIKIYL